MNDNKDLSKLTNEELIKELKDKKTLYYASLVCLLITFAFGIYMATRGMGFFKIVGFVFICGICLKYISQYSNLQKEMKSRNLK